MISEMHLMSMLDLQDSMNSKINHDWVMANNNWYRAIQVEGVEAIEHHGWKWWKKQDCDWAQLRMELVDIWHFILSAEIQHKHGNTALAKIEMIGALNLRQKSVQFDNQYYILVQLNLLEKLDLMVGLAAARRVSLALFESLLHDCNMSWSDLLKQYVGKNVLNMFRQDHGYKDGSYIKIWEGVEDNEHLAALMDVVDLNSLEVRNEIYNALQSKYILVQNSQVIS